MLTGLALLALGVVGAAISLRFLLTLATSKSSEVRRSNARTKSWRDLFMGRSVVQDDWLPDARVQAGAVFNKKVGRIEVTGRISNDTIERTFR